jgi:hypothetical protein
MVNTAGIIILGGLALLGIGAWRIRRAEQRKPRYRHRDRAPNEPVGTRIYQAIEQQRAGETALDEKIVKAWREWS